MEIVASQAVEVFRINREIRRRDFLMKKALYDRQVQMIDGLVLQGASVEEIGFFLNMSVKKLEELMDLECIDIRHRKLTTAKKDFLEERKTEFISNFSTEEHMSDADISKLFNISLSKVRYYKEPYTDINALMADFARFQASRKEA